tara:strand:+ start:2117 stop:3721 length:1605 start_codon:yes stop_codon:yes gene_type:complete
VDGQLVAFAEEERFTRVKHAPHVHPSHAIAFCLDRANLREYEVDFTAIGFERPGTRHVKSANASDYVAGTLAEQNRFDFLTSLGLVYYDTQLASYGERRYYDHHLCHAASAAIPSDFDQANVITLDGWGGATSGMLGYFDRGDGFQTFSTIDPNRSWGMVYELVTDYLGFKCHSAEGKTMGLASYGRVDSKLLPNFCEPPYGLPDVHRYEAFVTACEPPRRGDMIITDRHRNLAATIQHYYETSLVKIARWMYEKTDCKHFVLSGGVALNCSANGRLAQHNFVDELFVQPASHDAGTALGAAVLAHQEISGDWPKLKFDHAYWGPSYSSVEVKAALDFAKVQYQSCDPVETAAEALANNEIVGWFQGAAEVGPRALGNRSILANPSFAENLSKINRCVKRREPWRPLAPSIQSERFHDVFEARLLSPFMLMSAQVKPQWQPRLPAVVHVDGSARPQSVSADNNKMFYQLIGRFEQRTGLPAVLNTSFNLNDEPLVNSPENAIATFYRSGIETLIIGDFVVRKTQHLIARAECNG